ncbi:MAG: hypothetical protein QNJ58_07695 [Desulfobacterales bacterium]|nr:hypothetical protein [Desulfobacterales bacterium]
MKALSLEQVCDLLGRSDIPGSAKELEKLCIRIHELVKANGEDWVIENRQKLLSEWDFIIQHGVIS